MIHKAIHFGDSATNLDEPSTNARTQLWTGWAPLIVLPTLCIAVCSAWAPWVFMWLLAVAIFTGCKWQTWWEMHVGRRDQWRRSVAYLLLWPGMDAEKFLQHGSRARRVSPREWSGALIKTAAGVASITAAKHLLPTHPFAAAWVCMIGLVLLLHFGVFYLIALTWQSIGICADPIMQHPIASQSLGEFWGKRWNLGFRALSHKLVFRPLQRRHGTVAATFAAFLASGMVHDIVISVPARGGYGLPTMYFFLQGVGVVLERSRLGKQFGLGSGVRGGIWMAVFTLGPVFFLFHPWFISGVMVPFLRAI